MLIAINEEKTIIHSDNADSVDNMQCFILVGDLSKRRLIEKRLDSLYKAGNELFTKQLYAESVPYLYKFAESNWKRIYEETLFISYQDEESRRDNWAKYKDVYIKQIPFLALHCQADSLIAMALDASLLSKGLLLKSSIVLKQAIVDYYPSFLETYNRFEECNLKCRQYKGKMLFSNKYKSLMDQRDSLNKILYDNIKPFHGFVDYCLVSWESIRSVLDDKDVAIDFVEIPMDDMDNLYVAFVLKKSYDYPKMVYLFKKSDLPLSRQYPIVNESIAYSKIWYPLSALMQGSENVYFSPTGLLHRIGVEYLPDEKGLPINWHYNMQRLSNLKEILFNEDSIPSLSRVGLIGGLYYGDINNGEWNFYHENHRIAANNFFSYLPASLSEIQDVKEVLERTDATVDIYTGDSFTESAIAIFQGVHYDILHFATHSFCLNEEDTVKPNMELDALSYSGIALSGANNYYLEWLSNNDNRLSTTSDNLLTSLEISKMNLAKVKMAILSTCGSGLGLEGEDGIYGLQMAFKKAGVESLLVSLWDIDDEATSIFITSFYRYYIQSYDMFQALKLAQQELCLANNGMYNHPKYWKSFILLDGIEKTPKGKKRLSVTPDFVPKFGL